MGIGCFLRLGIYVPDLPVGNDSLLEPLVDLVFQLLLGVQVDWLLGPALLGVLRGQTNDHL